MREITGVDCIETREVADVGEEAGRLQHTVDRAAGLFEHKREVVHCSSGLLLKPALHYRPARRIAAELPGYEDEIAVHHGGYQRRGAIRYLVAQDGDRAHQHSFREWGSGSTRARWVSRPLASVREFLASDRAGYNARAT